MSFWNLGTVKQWNESFSSKDSVWSNKNKLLRFFNIESDAIFKFENCQVSEMKYSHLKIRSARKITNYWGFWTSQQFENCQTIKGTFSSEVSVRWNNFYLFLKFKVYIIQLLLFFQSSNKSHFEVWKLSNQSINQSNIDQLQTKLGA